MPAVSEKQRKFFGAELARLRSGKKTKTKLSEQELRKFARKGTNHKGGKKMAKHGGPRVVKGKSSHGSHNSLEIQKTEGGFVVVNTETGKTMSGSPHKTREAAQKQLKALQAAAGAGKAEGSAIKSKGKKTTGHLK